MRVENIKLYNFPALKQSLRFRKIVYRSYEIYTNYFLLSANGKLSQRELLNFVSYPESDA